MPQPALALRFWAGLALLLTAAACGADPAPKPLLAVTATVPLLAGEGDIAAQMDGSARPMALRAMLAEQWTLRPLDDVAALPRIQPQALLMVQPRALAAAELAALDDWLRGGGRALLVIDPALVWPSELALGDPRRPLFTAMLSPLLARWGIELVLPVGRAGEAGGDMLTLDGQDFATAMPGRLLPLGADKAAACTISDGGLVADCRIGKGRALIIADADWLDDRRWPGGLLGADTAAGKALLARLETVRR